MDEKQKNDMKPEFKGNLGFIWLIGILVILLGCTVFYTLRVTKENKELRQTSQEQTVQPAETNDNTKAEETAKVENTISSDKTQQTSYSYSGLEGVYVYKEEVKRDGEKVYNNHELYLYRDGTYQYIEGIDVTYGSIGNYTIDGNKVTLNSWFETGSDVTVTLNNEHTTYTIDKNGTIGKMKKTKDKLDDRNNVMEILKNAIMWKAVQTN